MRLAIFNWQSRQTASTETQAQAFFSSACMQVHMTVWWGFILHTFSSASLSSVMFCGSSRCRPQGTREGESHCCEHTAPTQGKWHQPHLTSSHTQHLSGPSKVAGWINVVQKATEESTDKGHFYLQASGREKIRLVASRKVSLCNAFRILSRKLFEWVQMEGREKK